jgi:hypothetical protein
LFHVEEGEETVAEAGKEHQVIGGCPTELDRSASEFDREEHETRNLGKQNC